VGVHERGLTIGEPNLSSRGGRSFQRLAPASLEAREIVGQGPYRSRVLLLLAGAQMRQRGLIRERGPPRRMPGCSPAMSGPMKPSASFRTGSLKRGESVANSTVDRIADASWAIDL